MTMTKPMPMTMIKVLHSVRLAFYFLLAAIGAFKGKVQVDVAVLQKSAYVVYMSWRGI
jgi:hypothetical protein